MAACSAILIINKGWILKKELVFVACLVALRAQSSKCSGTIDAPTIASTNPITCVLGTRGFPEHLYLCTVANGNFASLDGPPEGALQHQACKSILRCNGRRHRRGACSSF